MNFPTGEFTILEAAQFNNLSRAQILATFNKAVEAGAVVKSGQRKAAGRGRPADVFQVVEAGKKPVISAPAKPVEVVAPEITPPKQEAWLTDFKCPACQNKLWAIRDATGVMVWCGQPKEVCAPQDVSGHARNESEAFRILQDKWSFCLR